MAAQKSYQMDFVLNAVMNGGFSGVFSKAQQQFVKLGQEIKNLRDIQKDVSAYQKQVQAVENTTAKLQNLQAQQGKVREQIEALGRVQTEDTNEKARNEAQTAKLEQEYLKYEQRIAATQAALEKQQGRLETLGNKLQEAGVDTGNLARKEAELAQQSEKLKQEQQKVTEELEKGGDAARDFGDQGSESMEAVASAIAAAGIVKALGEIRDAYDACVAAASDFEYAMSGVEAIAGATSSEMEALTEKAKETGLTTVYTAQESAQAMYYMAMAGWDAQEMLDGMSGMVNLAAAAGEDLAEVSDIVTDNLTAFGLKASDTAHFADVLAKTAASSNTNISIMGDTFKSSSALAGALGYSIEDVSVAVGLMANSAVKGTRAGTALRNIFNGFVEGMTLTGQSFGEVEVSAVNADGSVKSFMETVRVLREYFSQMTGAEKIENAYGIAGMRGYNGLLAIVNATDEDFQKLYDDINDCSGAAQEMADIKLDNMKGDLTLMQSAWEGLKITIGEQFEPEMRSLYSLGTDVFDLASDFVKNNPVVVKTIAGTAAVLMGVTTALTAIAAAKKAVAALELGTLFGVGAGPILAVAAAIGVAVSAVTALATEATEGIPKLADLTEETLSLRQAMEDAGDTYDDTTAQTLATVAAAENYLDKLDQLDQGSTEYNNTLALLEETMPELGEYITETTDKFGRTTYVLNTTTDALRENIQAWKENAMAQALQEEYQSVYQNYAAAMVEQQKKSIELTRAKQAETDAEAKYNAIWQERAALIDEAEKKAQAWNKENPTLTQTYEAFLDREKYDELTDALEDQDHEWDKASDTVATYEAALAECDETVEQGAEEVGLLDAAYKEMVGDAQDGADANRDLNVSVEDVVASVEELAAAYSEAYEDARESIRKQESLWDELPEVAAKSVGEITNTLNEHTQYWSNYNANLETILSHSGEIDGLAAVVADLAGDYSEESVNVAAGIADALERGDTAKVTEMINAWLRYQAVMDEAAQTNTMITQDIAGDMEDMSAAISSAIENAEDTDSAYDAALQVAMAYIDGFADQSPTISAAFQQVALDAINAALGTAYRSLENASIATSQLKTPGMDGYAGGTTNATAGIHLVGEHGPELVSFRGGERVLTAARTQAALESYGGNSYTVSVNVEGNATEDTAREIARQVRDALEEIDEDRRRRAYV